MNLKTIKPVNEKVLVRVAKTPSKIGSLYVPDTKRTLEAIVISKAEDCKLKLSPGDRVIYDFHSGIRPDPENENYLLLTKDDILAVLEED